MRAAGAPVTVAVEGAAPELPAAVDHCAYRILQESLTNVLRHAGAAATVGIMLRYRPGALDIEVTDDGAGAPAAAGPAGDSGGLDVGGGHGLTGMTERVSALGGTVRAGPRPGGGFEVIAHLPFGAAAAAGGREPVSVAIRVLLADDQTLVRAGFRVLIEAAPDMRIVAEAGDGGHAVALTREHRPDVVLMDLRMPEVDGITATRRISTDPALAAVRVIVLTTFDDDENVLRALRAGASGFLVKDVEPADLLQAIRVVACGDALLAPRRDAGAHPGLHLGRRGRGRGPAAPASRGGSGERGRAGRRAGGGGQPDRP